MEEVRNESLLKGTQMPRLRIVADDSPRIWIWPEVPPKSSNPTTPSSKRTEPPESNMLQYLSDPSE
jgi:hypothetical protein